MDSTTLKWDTVGIHPTTFGDKWVNDDDHHVND
jgi:hypothetical protein